MFNIFLEKLETVGDEEFQTAKGSILEALNEFSIDLLNVSSKYYLHLNEQFLNEDDQTYEQIAKTVTQSTLHHFAKQFLINTPRRFTIELFSDSLTNEEKDFKLEKELNLDKKGYDVVDLEALIAKKLKEVSLLK